MFVAIERPSVAVAIFVLVVVHQNKDGDRHAMAFDSDRHFVLMRPICKNNILSGVFWCILAYFDVC